MEVFGQFPEQYSFNLVLKRGWTAKILQPLEPLYEAVM